MAEPPGNEQPRRRRRRRRRPTSLPTVHEYSAGGLVVDGLDRAMPVAAVIAKSYRNDRTCWTLPKGHIEIGEKPEQTAVREIAEETGIRGRVLASLGEVDYWFRSEEHIVHKTVLHYLLGFLDGELSPADHEVEDVAWVPLDELPSRLTYSDEGRVGELAAHFLAKLRVHGSAALPPLPPSRPWRRAQTHSIARNSGDRRGPGTKRS